MKKIILLQGSKKECEKIIDKYIQNKSIMDKLIGEHYKIYKEDNKINYNNFNFYSIDNKRNKLKLVIGDIKFFDHFSTTKLENICFIYPINNIQDIIKVKLNFKLPIEVLYFSERIFLNKEIKQLHDIKLKKIKKGYIMNY